MKIIFISEELRDILKEIESESLVASLLLKEKHDENDLVENHVNYISLASKDKTKISYLTQDRITSISESGGDFWTSSRRFQIKPGSFVSKLFKNINQREIEIFSTLFRTQSNKPSFSLSVVSGKEIKKWYSHKYYSDCNSGTLGKSCMKHDFCQKFLDIYTDNKCVSMLIMLNDDGLLIGRALLWEFDGNKIMDRIYTSNDSEYQFYFKQWATQNGYFYKSEQNWYNTLQFEMIGVPKKEIKFSISLDNFNHHKYPYMDTFKFIDIKSGKLYNYIPDDKRYIRTLCSSEGDRYENDYLLFDGIDRVLRHRSDCVYLDYLECYTTAANTSYSSTNNQYILNKHAVWDKEIGDCIFNQEWNHLNKKDKIEDKKNILSKLKNELFILNN